MKIKMCKLSEIKPYERNPRINEDAAVETVAGFIRDFGFRQPIVVDKDFVIICGHTRWKAAHKLGLELVPVHVAADLSPEKARAYRLADNRAAELSQWHYDLLPLELSDLREGGCDMSSLGWDEKEIASLLQGLANEGLPGEAGGKEYDETIEQDVLTVACPQCGHVFPK